MENLARNKGVLGFIFNYLGRTVSQVIGFFVGIYVIRQIPVDIYANLILLSSLLGYCTLFSSLGLNAVFQRFIPDLVTNQKGEAVSILLYLGLIAKLGISIFCVFIIFVFSDPIGNWLNFFEFKYYFGIYAFVIVANLLANLFETALTSLLNQIVTNLSILISNIIRGIGFFYVITHNMGLQGLIYAELTSNVIRLVILMSGLAEYFRKPSLLAKKPIAIDNQRVFKYGAWAYLNDVSYIFFGTDTDNFIISNYLGKTFVGMYGFANRVVSMVNEWSPITVGANVITPLFFERYSRTKDKLELDRLFGLINKIVYIFYLPVLLIVLMLNSKFITIIFEPKYMDATWLFIGALTFHVVNSYQFPLGLVVFALEKNQYNFYSRIFSLYNLVLDILLINFFGVPGVLFATGTAITLKNLFIYYKISGSIKLTWDWIGFFKIFINALLSSLFCLGFRNQITSTISLLVFMCFSGIIYLVLTYFNNVFSISEVKLINSILKRKIWPDKDLI